MKIRIALRAETDRAEEDLLHEFRESRFDLRQFDEFEIVVADEGFRRAHFHRAARRRIEAVLREEHQVSDVNLRVITRDEYRAEQAALEPACH